MSGAAAASGARPHGHAHGASVDPLADAHERQHLGRVVESFSGYETLALYGVQRSREYFARARPHHRATCDVAVAARLDAMAACMRANAALLRSMVHPSRMFVDASAIAAASPTLEQLSPVDHDKVRTLLRQLMRDWSSDGLDERRECFGPVLRALVTAYPDLDDRRSLHVLCPGCGLGRLPFDIARLGFNCEGNEFSYHMLIGSNFVLNSCHTREMFELFPYVHQTTNALRAADIVRPVRIPDMSPTELDGSVDFSMSAGEFVELFGGVGRQYDVVVTCFFLDTAKNVFEYVEVIANCLRRGGRWINIGPLLYHFADMDTEMSIELTWEELRSVIAANGFDFEFVQQARTHYNNNPRGLSELTYNSIVFVARLERGVFVDDDRAPAGARSPVFGPGGDGDGDDVGDDGDDADGNGADGGNDDADDDDGDDDDDEL